MIRILTDSMSDLTQEDASRLGITVLPMPVSFGEEERWEGIDLSREEFFARLRVAEELPHTSQIAPRAWQKETASRSSSGVKLPALRRALKPVSPR